MPEGTTVVSAPENCWAEGSATYRCELRHWTAPKDRIQLPFELRVDRVLPNATGAVTLHASARQAPYDPKPHNAHAELVLSASK